MSENFVIWALGILGMVIVWAVRIEGKVNAHDREIEQLRADTKGEMATLREDVRYIRDRIDVVLERRE